MQIGSFFECYALIEKDGSYSGSHICELNTTLIDVLFKLRSAGTYNGANRLKDFPKCCTFLQVNRQVNTVYDNKDYLV